MIMVIDASVAIKWFVAETGRDGALSLLDEVGKDPQRFVVPELFYNEMLSVLCRILSSESVINEHLQSLQEMGWTRVGHGSEVLATAVHFAKHHGLRGYDAIYAATAKLSNGTWVTADAEAHRKIQKLKISRLLGSF